MPMSDKTRRGVGIEPKGIDPASALGVVSSIIKSERQDLSKAEQMMEVASKALTVEDDPWNLLPNERKSQIIAPTYDPVVLSTLPLQNNVLSQLIEAMEVNIDGTGHDFERRDGEVKTDQEKKEDIGYLFDFFDNVFPGQSFVSLRRSIRRDRETTGNGYLEVIRDGEGKITLLNRLDAKLTRMVRLDDPVMTEKTIVRDGKEAKVKMFVRERRYAQIVGTKVIYFREFGSSRHLNALTGEWLDEVPKVKPHVTPGEGKRDAKGKDTDKDADKEDDAEGEPKKKANPFAKADAPKVKTDKNGNPLEYATEVIHFGLKSDVVTNYGVPRWVSQIPSILGSREAEELNLEYFRHGGLPPVMIMIQGGQLSQQSRTDLNGYLSGSAKSKTRAVIAEIFSTSGDLGSAGNVKATVERFGGDRQADSMFEGYDTKCAERVRSSFRLPPMFVGYAQDYSYATATASYLVAESQVFKPERELFDEALNATIMRELAPDYYFRSLPMTIHDVNVQLTALELVKDLSDKEEFVDEVNELAGLNLTYEEPPAPQPGMDQFGNPMDPFAAKDEAGGFPPKGLQPKKPTGIPAEFLKSDVTPVSLAADWADFLSGERQFSPESVRVMKSTIDALPPPTRELFSAYVGMRLAPAATRDPDGVAELLSCAGECLHGTH